MLPPWEKPMTPDMGSVEPAGESGSEPETADLMLSATRSMPSLSKR
jgi:hypothetical protein